MTIVTTLTLESGDRAALDGFVEDLQAAARRKGVELKGPHSGTPREYRIPLYDRVGGGDGGQQFDEWQYSVYRRRVDIVGHDDFARSVIDEGFPRSVHAEVEFSQVRPAGSG